MMNLQAAIKRRDLGMQRAVEKSNKNPSQWSRAAYFGIIKYIAENKQPFLTEDVREWCELRGCVIAPENGRAWGNVMKRAAKSRLILKHGYALAKSSNLSPKVLWKAS